ncbi:hypothetical protein VOM14_17020 [Paraburkholderia sp. MPAMCS5]|uniref:hypothetical protein n=1 Tax=Paraburkholderia sp. MPAMCS5 TaxID=3112563 RepID=UPI002E19C751|nr:hypothetical protein [Paraburkholderia sp. MPAMCS5]
MKNQAGRGNYEGRRLSARAIHFAEARPHIKPYPMSRFVPEESLQRLAAAARRRGLILLSKEWRGANGRQEFRCAHGHVLIRRADYVFADPQSQDGKWKTRCPIARKIMA